MEGFLDGIDPVIKLSLGLVALPARLHQGDIGETAQRQFALHAAEDHRYELMRDSVEAETEPVEADELKTHPIYGPLLQNLESVNTSSGPTW